MKNKYLDKIFNAFLVEYDRFTTIYDFNNDCEFDEEDDLEEESDCCGEGSDCCDTEDLTDDSGDTDDEDDDIKNYPLYFSFMRMGSFFNAFLSYYYNIKNKRPKDQLLSSEEIISIISNDGELESEEYEAGSIFYFLGLFNDFVILGDLDQKSLFFDDSLANIRNVDLEVLQGSVENVKQLMEKLITKV